METIRATTILCVRRDGRLAMGGDGQVTVGETVMKSHAQKVRLLKGGKAVAGFGNVEPKFIHSWSCKHAQSR